MEVWWVRCPSISGCIHPGSSRRTGFGRPNRFGQPSCRRLLEQVKGLVTMNFFSNSLPVEQWSSLLLEQGYCVIPDLLPRSIIESLDQDLAADFEHTPF